jgi:hypothetical protein
MSRIRKEFAIVGGILVFVAILAIPTERQAIPEWRMQVVDETGNPVPKVEVYEEWREFDGYSVYEDRRPTEANGRVAFPARVQELALSLEYYNWKMRNQRPTHLSAGTSGPGTYCGNRGHRGRKAGSLSAGATVPMGEWPQANKARNILCFLFAFWLGCLLEIPKPGMQACSRLRPVIPENVYGR